MEHDLFLKLLDIYEKEIRKNVRNKKQIIQFERHKMENLFSLSKELEQGKLQMLPYHIFLVYEPKIRVIMSMNIKDKIINHYLTREILIPKLEKYLDLRNIATRKNMGSSYGMKLIYKYMSVLKNSEFYILKLDIKKYFYSIDHDKLKSILRKYLTKEEFSLIEQTIDSTNEEYINKKIKELEKDDKLPLYKKNKGLPIGNLTSQFLSIFYLNELDHYIVHDLHLKYYVRYMDDFIIMSTDKKYLKKCKNIIVEKLEKEYFLDVNENKTKIVNSKEGFIFLGYHFKIKHNRVVCFMRNETIKKIKKNILKNKVYYKKNWISFHRFFASLNHHYYSYHYGSTMKIRDIIETNL